MRREEDRFGNFMEGRTAVSCSDLLLSLSHLSDKTKVGVATVYIYVFTDKINIEKK